MSLITQVSPLNMLVWYWGRRGAPVRLTHDLVQALQQRPDIHSFLSLSRQSDLFEETQGLGVSGPHIDTYNNIGSALRASARLGRVRREMAAFVAGKNIAVTLAMMRHVWSSAVFPAMRRAGSRVLMGLHDAAPHPGERYPFWHTHLAMDLRATDGLIVYSEHIRQTAIERFGYPAERIWLVPLAGMAYGSPGTPRQLPQDRPVRLPFFGRLLDYKGLDILADAYRQLAADLPVRLDVVGYGDDPAVATLAALPNVRLDQRWIPEDEIGGILERADIIIAPYREASQSGVIPAAYAAGVPVVATPVGGLAEQVIHEQTGLIAERIDAAAVAAAVTRLLSDSTLYAACSEGALAIANGTLHPAAIAGQLCDAARALAAMPMRN